MPMIDWSPSYETGIPSIDAEHQVLVRVMNDLYDAYQAGRGAEALSKAVIEMINYTLTHFTHEEELLIKAAYPGSEQHITEHGELREQIEPFRHGLEDGGSDLMTEEFLRFLKEWLIGHILSSDMAFAPYLKSRGIK